MNQTIGVNIVPQSPQPTLHYSQGDVGRVFVVNVTDYDIPTGATVTCVATKPSGMGFTVSGTVSGNSVTFTSTAEMTDEWGRFPAEIRIASGNTLLGTANFLMIGEKDPHPASTIDGTQEELIPQLTLLVNRVEAAAESVHDLTVSATTLAAGSDATATYDSENNSIEFGIPRGADGDVTRSEFNDLKSDLSMTDNLVGQSAKNLKLLDYSIIAGAYDFHHNTINTSNPIYYRLEAILQNEKYLCVSGFSYSSEFTLWGFLDVDGNVISYGRPNTTNTFYTDIYIEVPPKAYKVIVNASISTAHYEYPFAIKSYAEDFSELVEKLPVEYVGCNYVEMEGTYVPNKAKKLDGTEITLATTYCYKSVPLTGGESLYISGWAYSKEYPMFFLCDENDNVIYRHKSSYDSKQEYHLKMPSNARKIIVNGRQSTNQSYIYPSVKQYVGDISLYDVYNKVKDRKYLFIGDSYGEGYSHDGNNAGWIAYCAEYMGLGTNDYTSSYRGGASFSNSNNNFESLVPVMPPDTYTDIVVCGGYNDNGYTAENILIGIQSFITKCNRLYPSAKIHIGFVAWNKAGSGTGAEPDWENIHSELINKVLPTYQRCIEKGVAYLNNVEYWINDSGITPSDGYHPNESGNRSIARAVGNALLSGSAPLPYNENRARSED